MKKPPNPVRPLHAATLVAWRRGPSGVEVLMGRRAARHRFVPHHYVFPGGRVDRADYEVVPRSPLRPPVLRKLGATCGRTLAQALAVTAVRETWEETGLLLGALRDGVLLPDLRHLDYALRAITPAQSPIRFHARFFVVDARHLSGTLQGNGELLDLAWRPVAECLRLPIVDVTEYFLRRLHAGGADGFAEGRKAQLFSFRAGKARLT